MKTIYIWIAGDLPHPYPSDPHHIAFPKIKLTWNQIEPRDGRWKETVLNIIFEYLDPTVPEFILI